MKRLIAAAAIAPIATTSWIALAAEATDRPAGVAARDWIPVSARLGLVLVDGSSPVVGRIDSDTKQPQLPPGGMPLLLKPPANGYFMVKGASGWSRLVVVEPLKGPADAG